MRSENDTNKIGRSLPRADAFGKVKGEERFAADYYGQNFLWAGVKRAGIPHGRLKGVDTEKAKGLPGTAAVLTHKDIRGSNRQGVVRKDQPVLVDEEVRHRGDAVALVLAEDKTDLQKALDLIRMEIEALPEVFDPERALDEGSPIIHRDNPRGNTLLAGDLKTGSGEAALDECAAVVEATFELPWQEHAYLETETGWALLKADGVLEMVVSTQTPFRDRVEVAQALGLKIEKIRITVPYCGGAFGGKDGVTVQTLLALGALHSHGRPVKMWWPREESFLASAKRHPARLHYRLGAKADGTLHGLDARILYDTGPYDHLGGAVMALGLEHAAGPYRIANVSLEARSLYTNNPIGGAFRGFGVPQVTAAMEQMLDMLAAKLKLCPLELRLRNAVRNGDKNSVGTTLTGSTGIKECLERLKTHSLWVEKEGWKSSAPPFKRRGVGLACGMHGMGYGAVIPDSANAKIELTEEGKFRIFSGVVDMGQGNASTYLQIAREVLNQDPAHLEIVLPDTERTLPSGSASASRTTYTFGNALIGAAKALKAHILSRGADLFMAGEHEVILLPGRIYHPPTGRDFPLSQMARLLDPAERVFVQHFRMPVAKEMITKDEALRLHGIPHLLFSYTAHLAYIEVDELTGKVEVKRYLAITDCGRIINLQVAEQQMQGGIAQGVGYALFEELLVKDGKIENPDLGTYIIPTSLELPDMEVVFAELVEETGPFGLKGAGEISIDAPLPAISNAVTDALGVRIFRAPFTPERILNTMEKAKS